MNVANLRNGRNESRVMILSSAFHEAVPKSCLVAVPKTSNVFDRLPTQLKLTICHPGISWTLAHSGGGGGDGGGGGLGDGGDGAGGGGGEGGGPGQ